MKKKKSKKVNKVRNETTRAKVLIQIEQKPLVPIVREQDLAPEKDGGKYMIPKTWMSEKQVVRMVQRTPQQHIYTRPAKGGGQWSYVTGNYVEKVLNFTFGWNWDFEVVNHGKEGEQVWVLGKLTVKDDKGHSITKTQFGRADIKFRKNSKEILDFGNDLKAATTDALKKSASLLGIASDIYGKMEFKSEVGTEVANGVKTLPSPQNSPNSPIPMAVETPKELYCLGNSGKGCPHGSDITKQEHEYSLKIYKKPLCKKCQEEAKPWRK
jgi:hypothetical protein